MSRVLLIYHSASTGRAALLLCMSTGYAQYDMYFCFKKSPFRLVVDKYNGTSIDMIVALTK